MTTRVSRTPTLAAFLLKQWVYRECKKLWERSFQVYSMRKLSHCGVAFCLGVNRQTNLLLLNKKLLYASNTKGIFLANQRETSKVTPKVKFSSQFTVLA